MKALVTERGHLRLIIALAALMLLVSPAYLSANAVAANVSDASPVLLAEGGGPGVGG